MIQNRRQTQYEASAYHWQNQKLKTRSLSASGDSVHFLGRSIMVIFKLGSAAPTNMFSNPETPVINSNKHGFSHFPNSCFSCSATSVDPITRAFRHLQCRDKDGSVLGWFPSCASFPSAWLSGQQHGCTTALGSTWHPNPRPIMASSSMTISSRIAYLP